MARKPGPKGKDIREQERQIFEAARMGPAGPAPSPVPASLAAKLPHDARNPNTRRSLEFRARRIAEGWRPKSFLMPPDVVMLLRALAKARGCSEEAVLSALVRLAADADSL